MFVCCECCMLSGRSLCDGLITRPEESYRLYCVLVCDLGTSKLRRLRLIKGCNARTRRSIPLIVIFIRAASKPAHKNRVWPSVTTVGQPCIRSTEAFGPRRQEENAVRVCGFSVDVHEHYNYTPHAGLSVEENRPDGTQRTSQRHSLPSDPSFLR